MRTCTECGVSKPLDAYYTMKGRHDNGKTYYQTRCKACTVAANKARYTAEEHKYKALWTRYRIRPERVKQMFADQNNGCGICATPIDLTTAQVDHDHKCCSGRKSCGSCVRGLLCGRCNRIIANADDNVDVLAKAVAYLS